MVLRITLLLLVAFLYFANLGLNDIWQPNEAFYAETSREILENGNYLNLTYNYEPRLEKPPLTYWLTALSYKFFGINELATRLVPFGTAILTALLLILYGRFLKSWSFGITASIVFLFTLQVFALARYDSPEIPLTFFLSGALVFLHIYLQRRAFLTLLVSEFFLSLALLTKGIPFLVIYWGTLILYLFSEKFILGKPLEVGKKLLLPFAVSLIASIPILAWYLYAYLHYGELFIKVFQSEVINRALNPSKGWNLSFYFLVILWAFLPYSLLFYYSLPGLLLRLKKFEELLFPLAWFITVLGAFTLAKGKIPVYILPAFPAMAILTARLERVYHKIVDFFITFSSILMLVATVVVAYYFNLYSSFELWIFVLLTTALLLAPTRLKFYRPAVATVPLMFIFVFYILPMVEKYRPYKEMLTELKREFPNYQLATLGFYFHNFPFYWRGKVYKLHSIDELSKLKTKKVLLFAEKPLKGWKVIKKVELYKGSESRFIVFLRDIKNHKRFGTFYFQVKN